jgi:hypothetical protein
MKARYGRMLENEEMKQKIEKAKIAIMAMDEEGSSC